MRIALDYDGTYTLAPGFWNGFIMNASCQGHEVICVTMRYPDSQAVVMPCPIHYTSYKAKVPFMEAAGVKIDVWIDDIPKWLLHDQT